MPIADDFVRRESDQREDGLRRAAFRPDKSDRLKYNTPHMESATAELTVAAQEWVRLEAERLEQQVHLAIAHLREEAAKLGTNQTAPLDQHITARVSPNRIGGTATRRDRVGPGETADQ